MLQGETAVYQGYEVALFPMPYINCTQGNGSGTYSHCCGTMSDWAGPSANMAYYAPVSCHRVAGPTGSDNICTYTSDDRVWTPSGLKWLSFIFMHDDNPPSQTNFNQGEMIGHTGTAGFVTGDHVHLDQAFNQYATLRTDGTVCPGSGTTCYYVINGVQPDAAYFTTGSETIVSEGQFSFTEWDGSITPPTPTPGDDGRNLLWYLLGMASGRGKERRR